MKWCFTHAVQWWDDSCPASKEECGEDCDVDVLIRVHGRVLYTDALKHDKNNEFNRCTNRRCIDPNAGGVCFGFVVVA